MLDYTFLLLYKFKSEVFDIFEILIYLGWICSSSLRVYLLNWFLSSPSLKNFCSKSISFLNSYSKLISSLLLELLWDDLIWMSIDSLSFISSFYAFFDDIVDKLFLIISIYSFYFSSFLAYLFWIITIGSFTVFWIFIWSFYWSIVFWDVFLLSF
jgi:hypothetical protein